MRVIIIGAGIGGMAAALSLRRAGIEVDVFEQAGALREIGAGIQISPNATRILHRLGLARVLHDYGVRPLAIQIRRWDDGRILTLAGSRYLLLEPPHHVMPPQFDDCIFRLRSAGYVAILTHPERLSWIEPQYALVRRMVHKGLWIQLTAGSLTGRFGQGPRYWAERMLDEGLCHVMATDAHNTSARPPHLARVQAMVERRLGAADLLWPRARPA